MIKKLKQILFDILFRQTIVISSDNSLENKVILITGAGRGIGKSLAQVLAKKGAKVSLFSLYKKELDSVFTKDDNFSTLLISGSVTQEKDCKYAASETIKKFGRIDVLINNAGEIFVRPFEQTSEKDWDRVMATNVKGMFQMTKAVLPYMKSQKSGLVINMGSRISHNSKIRPNLVLYATTKFAVEGFTESLSNEFRQYGIRTTCLMPATVATVRHPNIRDYLSPPRLAEIVSMIIKQDDVQFERVIFKSVRQNI